MNFLLAVTFALHYQTPLTAHELTWFSKFDVLVTHDPLPRAQVDALHEAGTKLYLYEWTVAFVISPWSRGGVQHHFINTTDIVGAIGRILGLRPMSQFDLRARPLEGVFAEKPDLTPYRAFTPAVPLDEKNPEKTKAAELSEPIDFDKLDGVNDQLFNRILWEWRAHEIRTRNP